MLRWREANELERIWIVNPSHPIAAGLPVNAEADAEHFELPQTEMYGEFFDIPQPDELVFISWFEGGEVFRSGCTFQRGAGRIFYFRPGHETYPIYYDLNVKRVLANSVLWAAHQDNDAPAAQHMTHAREIKHPLSPLRDS
jgi:trehalose utilization protein